MWRKLYLIGLVACVGLVWEANLQVPEGIHHFLMIVWVLLVYGAISLWLAGNSAAIAKEQQKTVEKPSLEEFPDADRVWTRYSEDVETHEGGSHA